MPIGVLTGEYGTEQYQRDEMLKTAVRCYGSAEECYKQKSLRIYWLCGRCTDPRFGWVCAFGRGLEPTHGISPIVCGTCDNNENNKIFDYWKPGKCSHGNSSLSPCDTCPTETRWKPCEINHQIE